jgi:hypothetical protein
MEASGQLYVLAAFPLRRLGGSQSRSGRRGVEKNLVPLLGIDPLHPARRRKVQQFLCLINHAIIVFGGGSIDPRFSNFCITWNPT